MNTPNKITVSRFVAAIIIFVLLINMPSFAKQHHTLLWDGLLVLYILAALSDILDGYLARQYALESTFGRIADPFVDKIMICGAFILFLPHISFLHPWMVVVIIGREFLVSGIRGYAEGQGVAFPSNKWGKLKTLSQNFTLGSFFLYMAHFSSSYSFTMTSWSLLVLTLVLTVVSGSIYVFHAMVLFNEQQTT